MASSPSPLAQLFLAFLVERLQVGSDLAEVQVLELFYRGLIVGIAQNQRQSPTHLFCKGQDLRLVRQDLQRHQRIVSAFGERLRRLLARRRSAREALEAGEGDDNGKQGEA